MYESAPFEGVMASAEINAIICGTDRIGCATDQADFVRRDLYESREQRMDAKAFLDGLLAQGKELAVKGRGLAEEKLGVPKEGAGRDEALSAMGKGAALTGVLAVLLGTKTGRAMTGSAIKLGSLAAVGTVGYKAFKNWQAKSSDSRDFGTNIAELVGEDVQKRSVSVIKAMIAAAKADGHIDAQEIETIKTQMEAMDLDPAVSAMLEAEVAKPLDAAAIAAEADSPAAAVEIYLASKLVIGEGGDKEMAYLNDLASKLELPGDLVEEVVAEAHAEVA